MTNFYNLATGPMEKFVSYFRNHGCVWIFQHIPKTAGSSLTREMQATLPPYRNIHANREAVERQAKDIPDALMSAVDDFIETNRTRNYRSASGHLRQAHLRRIGEHLPHAKVFSFLREPTERLVSDYRYAKTPKHPPHQEFARLYPTIEAYLDDPSNNNKMWRFVRPNNGNADEASLNRVFRRYVFLGTVANLTENWEFLTGLTTCPRRPRARVNVTTEQTDNSVSLTPALRRRIEDANADDYTLYEAVEKQLAAKRREMAEFVAERRAFFGVSAAD